VGHHSINRRLFCQSLGIALTTLGAGLTPVEAAQTQPDRLARILGLEGAEVAWLADLTPAERATLLAALTAGKPLPRRAVDLLYQVIGRRERLFQYVGYRPLPNRLTACDGLIRE
jgi:hypothetical protein